MASRIPEKPTRPVRRARKVIAKRAASNEESTVEAAVDQVKAALATVERLRKKPAKPGCAT